ncbi:MAG: DUF1499 domain-containing protein [Pseudomonadota bacterium]
MIKTILTVIVVLAFIGVGGFVYLGQSSKNGSAPGLANGALAPCPESPNCVSSEEGTAGDKRVDPLPVDIWDELPAAIEGMDGVIIVSGESYIAAEFTSATFGFVDDLELRKADDLVHIRSASRVGYSDGGMNAKRVAELSSRIGK